MFVYLTVFFQTKAAIQQKLRGGAVPNTRMQQQRMQQPRMQQQQPPHMQQGPPHMMQGPPRPMSNRGLAVASVRRAANYRRTQMAQGAKQLMRNAKQLTLHERFSNQY
jgi:hypothetical protein